MQRLTHWPQVSRLKGNSLSVQSTHGQAKPEPCNGTQTRLDAFARYLAKKVDIPRRHRATCTDMLLRGIWSTTIPIAITRASVPAAPTPGSAGGTPAGGSECVRKAT